MTNLDDSVGEDKGSIMEEYFTIITHSTATFEKLDLYGMWSSFQILSLKRVIIISPNYDHLRASNLRNKFLQRLEGEREGRRKERLWLPHNYPVTMRLKGTAYTKQIG